MQRYPIGTARTREMFNVRYVGGVGDFDVFWFAEPRRLLVKWSDVYGETCPVSDDGAEDVRSLEKINAHLANRMRLPMTEEEYEVLRAIRKLFVVEFETSDRATEVTG